MKRMVYITKADIIRGRVGDCGNCPVALAASRAFKRPISVGNRTMGPACDSRLWVELPERIQNWIKRFDNDLPVNSTRFMGVI